MSQLELFAQPVSAVSTVPTVESVRARLEAVLAPLRSASELPWSAKETARWKLVVPQMADWLPPEERDAVRAEFEALILDLR
jgi:hypothetical protein